MTYRHYNILLFNCSVLGKEGLDEKRKEINKICRCIHYYNTGNRTFRPTWTSNIKGDNSISVLEQVEINGTKQQIMIRGHDQNNPVIIYVHGGPSVSEIPYAKYEDLLEKDFTVVNYDQRGSGKSYHFNEDYSNLTADVLVDDLLELTDYISKRFGKEKVILIGHSYGTYLGTTAAYKAPEKYEAYIGIGQVSNMQESEIDNLNYTISEAKKPEIQKM